MRQLRLPFGYQKAPRSSSVISPLAFSSTASLKCGRCIEFYSHIEFPDPSCLRRGPTISFFFFLQALRRSRLRMHHKMLLFEVCIVPSALCPPSAANSMLSHVVFSYILNDRTSNKSKRDNGWAYTNVNRAESIFFLDLAHITDCFSTGGLYWTEVHFEHLESALTTLT